MRQAFGKSAKPPVLYALNSEGLLTHMQVGVTRDTPVVGPSGEMLHLATQVLTRGIACAVASCSPTGSTGVL